MSRKITSGEWLSEKMSESGVTVQELTKYLGLRSSSNVGEWCAGTRIMPLRHVRAVCRKLGRQPTTLLAKVEEERSSIKATCVPVGISPRHATANIKVTVQHKVQWISCKIAPPPSNEPHWRYDSLNKKVVGINAQQAIHAPHPNVTHWAAFEYPQPPSAV
jgi:hypothetical protein